MATDKRIGFSQVLYAKLAGFVDRYIGIFIPGRLLKIRKLITAVFTYFFT